MAPTTAVAQQSDLDAGLGTVLPVSIGLEATGELPYRILLQGGIGWLPSPYVDLINEVVMAFGGYNQSTADLIKSSLEDSLVVRLAAGMRPFRSLGLELTAGYTLIALGGGISSAEVIEAARGIDIPDDAALPEYPTESVLHNLHVTAGYRWVILDHLVLRASLSYFHCFAASSIIKAEARNPRMQPALDSAASDTEDYLNDTYTTYVKLPVASVSASYRF